MRVGESTHEIEFPNADEIIVTADKRRESINDVPMSISAITGDQLAEKGVVSAADDVQAWQVVSIFVRQIERKRH
jgi:hypothetical protein